MKKPQIFTKEVNYLERRLFARYIPRDVSGEEPPFEVINSYLFQFFMRSHLLD